MHQVGLCTCQHVMTKSHAQPADLLQASIANTTCMCQKCGINNVYYAGIFMNIKGNIILHNKYYEQNI